MNLYEKQLLEVLLRKLICAQDSVTHMNEQGPNFGKETAELIKVRDDVRAGIIKFVDQITKEN